MKTLTRSLGPDRGKVRLYQIRRIGKGCMSYILESDGNAAIIDPVYPIEYYLSKVSEMGANITKVFDTHQHADHVFCSSRTFGKDRI